MSDLRILVVEDSPNWQEALPRVLQQLGSSGSEAISQVDVVGNYRDALNYINNQAYDLAIIDLALLGDPADPQESDQLGMELLRDLRNSRDNQRCGLIVLTGYSTTSRTRQALREYAAYDFIDKSEFDGNRFIETARLAILEARLRQATVTANTRYYFTINFGQKQLLGCTLTGPDHRSTYIAEHPTLFDADALIRRAHTLTTLLSGDQQNRLAAWQSEAHTIGNTIYQALANDQRLLNDLSIARAKTNLSNTLWLQFSGAASSLGIPFEILRYEEEYLGLRHILTRQLVQAGSRRTKKPEPFRVFIEGLQKRGETLRILIVGVNVSGDDTHTRAASPTSSPDIYATYEAALAQVLNHLGHEHDRFTDTLVYQHRLMENITQSRRYGNTDTRRAERSEIIEQLNALAMAALGISFNEICRQIMPDIKRTEPEHADADNASTVQAEVTSLTRLITTHLHLIGVTCEVTKLVGTDATYEKISSALRNGRHHIFHYAGHGRHGALLPEMCGLMLHSGGDPSIITADNLKLLVQDTDLRMAFLSCCLGTSMHGSESGGTFLDTLAALVRADVPTVLGYRWAIPGETAAHLALKFYQALWRSFSPGAALLEARRVVALSKNRGYVDAWAAPVLVMQNV